MGDIPSFITHLRPIEKYHFSRSFRYERRVHLVCSSEREQLLTLEARGTGLFRQMSEGTVASPMGNVVFKGGKNWISGREAVSLESTAGGASAELIFPRFFGLLSCCRRARLSISGDSNLLFDIWLPSARFQETVGRFRRLGGKRYSYKIFSSSHAETMLPRELSIPEMSDEQWLLLLSGLLYFCMHPEWLGEFG
jgi:hypothetical protein